MLIALVAVLHVFVSHFAVGGGFFLVLTENLARRQKDASLLEYCRRHSRFFALLTLVFGAISGVGIWFTIGLVSPEATSTLIHTFVWAWAIEWVFFFVEIAAAIIYYKTWDSLPARDHQIVGWIYFVAAWMSLFVINGILTFMLTPGRWIETQSFWDGMFNPTFLPSLVARTAVCVILAGIFGYITLPKQEGREKVARWAALWMIAGALVLPLSLWWYFARIPQFSRLYLNGVLIGVRHAVRGGVGFTLLALCDCAGMRRVEAALDAGSSGGAAGGLRSGNDWRGRVSARICTQALGDQPGDIRQRPARRRDGSAANQGSEPHRELSVNGRHGERGVRRKSLLPAVWKLPRGARISRHEAARRWLGCRVRGRYSATHSSDARHHASVCGQ